MEGRAREKGESESEDSEKHYRVYDKTEEIQREKPIFRGKVVGVMLLANVIYTSGFLDTVMKFQVSVQNFSDGLLHFLIKCKTQGKIYIDHHEKGFITGLFISHFLLG